MEVKDLGDEVLWPFAPKSRLRFLHDECRRYVVAAGRAASDGDHLVEHGGAERWINEPVENQVPRLVRAT